MKERKDRLSNSRTLFAGDPTALSPAGKEQETAIVGAPPWVNVAVGQRQQSALEPSQRGIGPGMKMNAHVPSPNK